MPQAPFRGARLISAGAQGNSRLGSSSSNSLELTWDVIPRASTENEVRLITLVREYSAGREDARILDNIFELLYEETSPNVMDPDAGRTALHWAVLYGQTQLVRALLEAGAVTNTFAKDGLSPLMAAVRKGSTEVVELLLEEGAKIDLINTTTGYGALQLACVFANTELVQLLLEHRATPDVQWNGPQGVMTPLGVAASKVCEPKPGAEQYLQVVEQLLSAGACPDVMVHQDKGETLFHNAVARNQPGLVRALLAANVNVELPTKDGVTPLMTAVRLSTPELVEALLEGGAAVEAVNEHNGKTALSVACNLGNPELVQLLMSRGASATTRWYHPNDYNTPILAVSCKCDDSLGRGSFFNSSNVAGTRNLSRDTSAGSTSAAAVEVVAVATATVVAAAVAICGKGGRLSSPRGCSSGGRDAGAISSSLQHTSSVLTATSRRHTGTQVYLDIIRMLVKGGADPDTQGSKHGTTPLLIAVENNHMGLLQLLLEEGANPNLPDSSGCTPLIAACLENTVDLARVLLQHGAKPNVQRRDGWTALMGAVLNQSTALVELLLAAGAHHHVLVPPGELLTMESTALMAAGGEGSLELVKLLLGAGADPNIANVAGQTALWCACRGGRAEAVQMMMAAGAMLRPRGQTPIHPSALVQASHSGNIRCVELLLEAGVNVDEYDSNSLALPNGQLVGGRYTALAAACSHGCRGVTELLLRRGAKLDVSWTVEERLGKVELWPLLAAVSYGWSDDVAGDAECAALVELLLAAGAAMEVTSDSGARCAHTALEVAAREGRAGALKVLLGRGGQANLVDKDGATPLILAALKGSVEGVKLLLAAGANANATTLVGVSPLVAAIGAFAAGDGQLELIRALLDAGAAPNGPFFEEDTILTAVVEGGNPALVATLLEAGADPNLSNTAGTLPLQLAVTKGHSELVRLLLQAGASPHLPNVDWSAIALRYHRKSRYDILDLLAAAGVEVPPPLSADVRHQAGAGRRSSYSSVGLSGPHPTLTVSASACMLNSQIPHGRTRRRNSQGGGISTVGGISGPSSIGILGGSNSSNVILHRRSSLGRNSGSDTMWSGRVCSGGSSLRGGGSSLCGGQLKSFPSMDSSVGGTTLGGRWSGANGGVQGTRGRPPPLQLSHSGSCLDDTPASASSSSVCAPDTPWASSAPTPSSGAITGGTCAGGWTPSGVVAVHGPSPLSSSSLSSAPPSLYRSGAGLSGFERGSMLASPGDAVRSGAWGGGGGGGGEGGSRALNGREGASGNWSSGMPRLNRTERADWRLEAAVVVSHVLPLTPGSTLSWAGGAAELVRHPSGLERVCVGNGNNNHGGLGGRTAEGSGVIQLQVAAEDSGTYRR